jgi:hypothetical protein
MVMRPGKMIQGLGGRKLALRTDHGNTKAHSPASADVEENDILSSVVTDVAVTTEIFLSEIEDGLGERHEVCSKPEKRGDGRIKGIGRKQVKNVDNELYDVEGG